jgi:hypothetical protein
LPDRDRLTRHCAGIREHKLDERPAMDDGMVKRIAERRRLAEANPRRPGESPEDHRRRLDALLGAQ